jgi:hypothetical protein
MKIFSLLTVAFLTLGLSGCSEDDLNTLLAGAGGELSASEIAEGLKQALIVGTDTSTATLSAQGGYLNDPVVKILLPTAVQSSISQFKAQSISLGFLTVTGADIYDGINILGVTIPGLKTKEDELIKGINRAAESAAATAAPVFVNAITDITIQDANAILFGGIDTAATGYLRTNTFGSLFNQYEPQIETALQSVTVGGTPVVDEYESFVAEYNGVLNTSIPGFGTLGGLMSLQTISATDLSVHATNKGLDGLFLKIAEEEKDIRENPLARVNAILERVFGALD